MRISYSFNVKYETTEFDEQENFQTLNKKDRICIIFFIYILVFGEDYKFVFILD